MACRRFTVTGGTLLLVNNSSFNSTAPRMVVEITEDAGTVSFECGTDLHPDDTQLQDSVATLTSVPVVPQ